MKSDSAFVDFLSSGKNTVKIAVVLLIGALFILIGSLGGVKNDGRQAEAEERCAEMCSLMEGVGECRVMITYSDAEEAEAFGVLVLCDGAESPAVREKITELFTSLYGVGSHRVRIEKLKK